MSAQRAYVPQYKCAASVGWEFEWPCSAFPDCGRAEIWLEEQQEAPVACSGPSNIALCCRVDTLCHSGVAMISGPSPCETATALVTDTYPSLSSDARMNRPHAHPRGRNVSFLVASALSTFAQGRRAASQRHELDAEACPREPKRPLARVIRAIRPGIGRGSEQCESRIGSINIRQCAQAQGSVLPSGSLRRSGIRVRLTRGHGSCFVVTPKNGEAPWEG